MFEYRISLKQVEYISLRTSPTSVTTFHRTFAQPSTQLCFSLLRTLHYACATHQTSRRHVLPQAFISHYRTSHFANFKTGDAADTRFSTNAFGNNIAAEHINEGDPTSNGHSPISLTSVKNSKEKRKVAAGKKRGTAAVDAFDVMFYGEGSEELG
jgi:hypothetical protein